MYRRIDTDQTAFFRFVTYSYFSFWSSKITLNRIIFFFCFFLRLMCGFRLFFSYPRLNDLKNLICRLISEYRRFSLFFLFFSYFLTIINSFFAFTFPLISETQSSAIKRISISAFSANCSIFFTLLKNEIENAFRNVLLICLINVPHILSAHHKSKNYLQCLYIVFPVII